MAQAGRHVNQGATLRAMPPPKSSARLANSLGAHYVAAVAWIAAKVARRQEWAPGLITLGLDSEVPGFVPGQFANLALDLGGERVKRPYSLASAAHAPADFYLTLLPGGCFTPALFALRVGDPIELEDRANGFFTLTFVPPARHAWLIATGTGLGPFVSMLRSAELWQRFERVVLVHGVRLREHLAYQSELSALLAQRGGQLTYVPLVSREEPGTGALAGRITDALASGVLEASVGLPLVPEDTHVLLCGNPQMIDDMELALGERGLRRHRQRNPGHVTTERYW
jgi:ferredoxin/flavodoxin---NADP+ reductase